MGIQQSATIEKRVPTSSCPLPTCREGDEGRHAVRSLRVREGDIIEVCDGQGCLVQAAITTVDRPGSRAWAQPTAPLTRVPLPSPTWIVAVACTTLKGGRADWLVEKATELGAAELIPLTTTRWVGGVYMQGCCRKVRAPYLSLSMWQCSARFRIVIAGMHLQEPATWEQHH